MGFFDSLFGGSSSSSGPSEEERQQITRQFNITDTLATLGPQQYFPESTIADTSPLSLMADQAALGTLGQQELLGQAQLETLAGLLQGGPGQAGGFALPERVEAVGVDPARRAPAQELRARLQDLGNVSPIDAALSNLGLNQNTRVRAINFDPGDTLGNVRSVQDANALLDTVGAGTLRQFNEEILPSIGSEAIRQGAFGGSRQALAEAAAARGATDVIAEQRNQAAALLRQQDIGQRGQDIQAELGRLDAVLSGRGQDIQSRTAEVGFGLQQQQQQLEQSLANAGFRNRANELNQATALAQRGQDLQGSLNLADQRQDQLNRTVQQRGQDINAQLEQTQQSINAQLSALRAAPGVNSSLLAPANTLAQVGSQQQGREQQLIDAAIQRFNFNQQAPINLLERVGALNTGLNISPQRNDRTRGSAAQGFGQAAAGIAALMTAGSDIRLKRDITRVGKHGPYNTYKYKYLWSDQEYIGVMAQEVQQIKPSAVIEVDGYLAVNYGEL